MINEVYREQLHTDQVMQGSIVHRLSLEYAIILLT